MLLSSSPRRARPHHLRQHRKGASYGEYAIILCLLGATSAGLVLNFSRTFIQLFEISTEYQRNAQAYAQTDGVGRILLADGTPATGQVGVGYTWNPGTGITQAGLFYGSARSWQATNLPAGLSIDPSTGVISGTPTTAGTFPVEVTVSIEQATDTQTYTLTIIP